jgi:hypothetical protein
MRSTHRFMETESILITLDANKNNHSAAHLAMIMSEVIRMHIVVRNLLHLLVYIYAWKKGIEFV